MTNTSIYITSFLSIFLVLIRPWKLPEWVWATAGSLLLVITQLIPLTTALHAVREGIDVYFFLIGMMLLSEQARSEGLFEWLAGWTRVHARGSSRRLFVLIYGAGILVTAFLSNDATAVVMTPAVYASVKKAGAKPVPYLFACAFIANAASFLLPISNPANLVVYASKLPRVFSWMKMFFFPSLASIIVTFSVLWIWFKKPLSLKLEGSDPDTPALSTCGKLAAAGLTLVIVVMLLASSLQWDLGLPTLLSALSIVIVIGMKKGEAPVKIFKDVSWGVIPLVAGLFIIVEAVNQAGALRLTHEFLIEISQLPSLISKLAAAFSVGIVSNLANNLPVGLISGAAVHEPGVSDAIRNSVLVGVDLGPNLSVTGSLATILWLMAIRREGENVSGWEFLKVGLIAMPLALAAAILVT